MATESLIVELDAKTGKIDAKLKTTQDRLNALEKKVDTTDDSFAKFANTAKVVATAVTAAAAAVTIMAKQAVTLARELEVAAIRNGETVENMQALAFATTTAGISLEKLGDIGKDTREKIGEFLTTGGGGFQDFADVLGLTAIEARKVAGEMANLSGTDVLQNMVTRMQEAGTSTQRMSFALEGMASDTTDLIPLLKNGGEEAKRLSDEFFDIGETLTQADVDKLKKMGEEFDKLGANITQSGAKLAANFSSEIITAISLFSTLSTTALNTLNLIRQGFDNIGTVLGTAIFDALNNTNTMPATIANLALESKQALFDVFGEDSVLNLLIGDPDEALARWIKAQKAIEDGTRKVAGTVTKAAKEDVKWSELKDEQKINSYQGYIKSAQILSDQFLEDNKALNAGLIVADTAAGVMKAIATSSNIYEGFANAAVVVATGIAQLSSLSSASKGGGSISSSGAAPSSADQGQQQQDTSTLDISEQGDFGTQEIRLIITDDSGNQFLDGIANGLEERTRQGR